jgi:hypothetical protein
MIHYLKLFLYSSITGVLLWGLWMSYKYGLAAGLWRGVIFGLLFALFFSLITGFLHTRAIKKRGYKISEETLDVHQKRKLELKLPYEEAYTLCLNSINFIPKSRIKKENRSLGRIDARIGVSGFSWGEVISFKVNKTKDDDRTYVRVSSKPIVPIAFVDWGKNMFNIESIIYFLRRNEYQSSSYPIYY